MELEFHQLDRRYETLRRRAPQREKRLLASLAEQGQQTPIIVVTAKPGLYVVLDGFKRIRSLLQLKSDVVKAIAWEIEEAEALLLERLMRSGEGDDAFEQGWLLQELTHRFGMSQEELARRFDKTKSWVSRRLALARDLPEEIQQRVRRGELVTHAAAKYLVPLARANRDACLKLVESLGGRKASSRQIGTLYSGWLSGTPEIRKAIVEDPWLFLRAVEESTPSKKAKKNPYKQILADIGIICSVSRRIHFSLQQGHARGLVRSERQEVHRSLCQAKADAEALFYFGHQEVCGDQSESPSGSSCLEREAARDSSHCPDAEHLA